MAGLFCSWLQGVRRGRWAQGAADKTTTLSGMRDEMALAKPRLELKIRTSTSGAAVLPIEYRLIESDVPRSRREFGTLVLQHATTTRFMVWQPVGATTGELEFCKRRRVSAGFIVADRLRGNRSRLRSLRQYLWIATDQPSRSG